MMPPEQREIHNRLQTDYPYFSEKALKVKAKSGDMVPFIFNEPQQYLHEKIESQKARTGRVRVIILKARQEGCSTYVGGRFYHQATRKKNKSVFILSHEAETTVKLFRIVERYHQNCPAPLKPPTRISNRREFIFDTIGSDYSVGTAGNEDVGRGATIQYFHGSEVAFWENTDGIQTGIMQCIPDMDDTEIILESTANGMGNMFYNLCVQAMKGIGEYELIFLPWFWMSEYRKAAPADFKLNAEEEKEAELYDLDNDQMYWRRTKIESFENKIWKFRQEYPANAMEAFQTSGAALIDTHAIMAARKSKVSDPSAALIIGVDPGRNRDRTVVAFRRGRQFFRPIIYEGKTEKMTEMRLAGIIAKLMDKYHPKKVFCDVGAGYGTIDRLYEMGYGQSVVAVHFGESAMEEDLYRNKRTEMWINMRDFIQRGGCSIPDDDAIHADLACMPDYEETSNQIKFLLPKSEIRKKYGASPDIGDAMALTFAYPVASGDLAARPKLIKKVEKQASSSFKTLRRMRGSGRQPGSQTIQITGS